jgi:hypothetical protein
VFACYKWKYLVYRIVRRNMRRTLAGKRPRSWSRRCGSLQRCVRGIRAVVAPQRQRHPLELLERQVAQARPWQQRHHCALARFVDRARERAELRDAQPSAWPRRPTRARAQVGARRPRPRCDGCDAADAAARLRRGRRGRLGVQAELDRRRRARRAVTLRDLATGSARRCTNDECPGAANTRNRSESSHASPRGRGSGRRRVSAEAWRQLRMDRNVLDYGARDGLCDPELAEELVLQPVPAPMVDARGVHILRKRARGRTRRRGG